MCWAIGLGGALLTGSGLVAVESLGRSVPGPETFLLAAVVLASALAGGRCGLTASLLGAAALGALLHRRPGGGDGGTRPVADVVVFAVAACAVALLVGALQARSERRYVAERRMRERLEGLDQVKSQFLNIASHELRGPLAVTRGYVAMLADGSFGPLAAADVRRAVPVLASKLDEMNALVDSMLDTARLEEHRMVLRRQALDLRSVVDAAVEAVFPALTPAHELSWRRPSRPVEVLADEARVAIVVTNLLQNAVKYSPAGGVIECFLAADAGRAVLTVWDHGLGIASSDLPRLFTRFGRIVTRQNSNIAGTGLGLYLARELARLHGGDLVVQSSLGRGSSFTLLLPLDEAVVEQTADSAAAAAVPPQVEAIGPSVPVIDLNSGVGILSGAGDRA